MTSESKPGSSSLDERYRTENRKSSEQEPKRGVWQSGRLPEVGPDLECHRTSTTVLHMKDTYATDEFIEAVRKCPCIWDSSDTHYLEKKAKRTAWEEVLAEMYADYHQRSPEEKIQLIGEAQKKWRNIKDSFTKEVNRQRRDLRTGVISKRRTYRYFRQLRFLLEYGDYQSRSRDKSSVSADDRLVVGISPEFVKTEAPDLECDSPRSTTPASYVMPPIHPDLAFFVSLLPAIQALDPDQKLVFQMQVLRALRNVTRPRNNSGSECDRVYDISELKTEEVSMDSAGSFDN